MRTSTARSQRSWEPHTLFVCFALLAAASFEIQGLVKDLQSVSAREQSEFQSDARSGGENDKSSRPEELTSRNHDESEEGGSDPSLLQAVDAAHQSSAPSIRPLHRGTRHGATHRSPPSAPPWTLRSRPRLRSCVLSYELQSIGNGKTRYSKRTLIQPSPPKQLEHLPAGELVDRSGCHLSIDAGPAADVVERVSDGPARHSVAVQDEPERQLGPAQFGHAGTDEGVQDLDTKGRISLRRLPPGGRVGVAAHGSSSPSS